MARKILLADDSVTAQNMGRKILADAGYDVVTVNNGSAALKRVSEAKPDLIVLDVYMPGYSGLEVCQRLKDSPETEHIPVLLTVGKLEPFKPEEARRVRADAHIIKPFEASELLTAITRLEDRMVPQQPDGSRFSASVSGVERFSGDGGKKAAETDTSWKNRLRFPSKKKKEEPEPEPEDAEVANYRDFRKGKGKNAANAPFSVKAPPPPGQEPGLVPDIPRDITPEELDALSALAAKLDGPIPAAENIAPLAEKMGPSAAPLAEVTAPSTHEETAATQAAAEVSSKEKEEIAGKIPDAAPVAAPAVAEFAVEAPAAPVEIPVAHTEPAAQPVAESAPAGNLKAEEALSGSGEAQSSEPEPKEIQKSELLVTVPVSTASFVEEPAPVDRTDEPAFADAASVVAQAAEAQAVETKADEVEKPVEAVAENQTVAASATSDAVASASAETKSETTPEIAELKAEESKADELKAEAPKTEHVEPPAAVAAVEPEPQEPAPTDEELAEALRLLTPSAAHAEASTVPTHGTLVAAGQLLAEEVARHAANAPRWVAQPVTLSPEEVTLSLEAEMRAFAATTATLSAASQETMETPATISPVSAIAAAVENRMASMDLAPPAKSLAEPESAAVEATRAQEEPGDGAGNKATPFVVASAHDAVPSQPAGPEKTETPGNEPEPRNEVAQEAAPVTFADAMSKDGDETETTGQDSAPQPSQEAREETVERQDSSSEVGDEESMAKAKAGKSNWHQIHTAAAGAASASKDAVEAAKQAEPAAEEAPKVMAAAASAEGSNATPAPDAGTIASIVDSVMADLRPKIVEEIAKKLAGK